MSQLAMFKHGGFPASRYLRLTVNNISLNIAFRDYWKVTQIITHSCVYAVCHALIKCSLFSVYLVLCGLCHFSWEQFGHFACMWQWLMTAVCLYWILHTVDTFDPMSTVCIFHLFQSTWWEWTETYVTYFDTSHSRLLLVSTRLLFFFFFWGGVNSGHTVIIFVCTCLPAILSNEFSWFCFPKCLQISLI